MLNLDLGKLREENECGNFTTGLVVLGILVFFLSLPVTTCLLEFSVSLHQAEKRTVIDCQGFGGGENGELFN